MHCQNCDNKRLGPKTKKTIGIAAVIVAAIVMFAVLLPSCGSAPDAEESRDYRPPEPAAPPVLAEVLDNEAQENNDFELPGFDTPEEALTAYLEGLRDSDLDRMLSAFAIEVMAENYDFAAMLERLQVYSPSLTFRMPNANDLALAMNVEARRSEVVHSIIMQQLSLTEDFMDDDFVEMFHFSMVRLGGPDDVARFVNQLSSALNALPFQTIEIIRFIAPEDFDDRYLSEHNQEILSRQANMHGADSWESRVVKFMMDGREYILFADVVQYGDRWYLAHFGGNIGALLNINFFFGGLVPYYWAQDLLTPLPPPPPPPPLRDSDPFDARAGTLEELTQNTIQATITMEDGAVMIVELFPDLAPQSVRNFVYLARQGFYDGLRFHRIIYSFMIQGGCPDSAGTGGPGHNIFGEFAANGFVNELRHTAGVLSMARRGDDYNSAGSQFFIVHHDAPFLDGDYATFGRVIQGLEVVNDLAQTPNSGPNGQVAFEMMPVIRSITIDSDVQLPPPDKR